MKRLLTLSLIAAAGCVVAGVAGAQDTVPTAPAAQTAAAPSLERGQAVFKDRCADCHDPAAGEAPDRAALAEHKADEIMAILKTGLMQPMAEGLSDADLNAVIAFVTTKPAAPAAP